MVEPSLALSAYDLVLDVALAANIGYYGSDGQQPATIPINQHDLYKSLRCVNRGIIMFIASAPSGGWRWMNRIMEVTLGTVQTEGTCSSDGDATSLIDTDLTDTYDEDTDLDGYYVYDKTKEIYAAVLSYDASAGDITVAEWLNYDDVVSSSTPEKSDSYSITDVKTVDGDKARYPLNQDFQGDVAGKITYAKGSNRGHIIDWVHESTVRFKREVSVTTGYPSRAAVRPWRKRRWELIVDPSPTAGDILIFPYRVGFNALQIKSGSIDASAATYITDSDRHEPADYLNNWVCTIISGTGQENYAIISDYESRNGIITAFADGGGGTVTVTSASHGLANGDAVTISGTTNYNGTFAVSSVADDTFKITDTWVADDATGSWVQRQIEVAEWLAVDGATTGVTPDTNSAYCIEPQNNKHPAGMQFDDAVRAACLAMAEREFDDLNEGHTGEFLERALPKAYEIDARSAPRKLGPMLPGNRQIRYRRIWSDVEYND